MSDGGKEIGRDQHASSKKSRSTGGDDFGHAIAKIAVAQICEATGFHGSHRSANDALARVAVRYICSLGRSANFYANLAGRTSSNVFDVIQAIQDLGLWRGFSGASNVHRCLVSTGVVREITQFVSTEAEVPFVLRIPRFPLPRIPKSTPSFAQVWEEPVGKHIPDWLPRLPDPHTYVDTPVWNKRATDAKADMVEQAKQRRKPEISLQQLLASNGAHGFQLTNDGDFGKGKQVVGSNPFLAPPLPYGEKEVSEIASPWEADAGKKLSVLETFAPAIQAGKAGSLDFNTNEKKVLPTRRSTVHLKIGVDKKSLVASLFSDALDDRNDLCPVRDDKKDDKKRRAEMILKEAMDNPHDLAQL